MDKALPLLCNLTKFRHEVTEPLDAREWSRRFNWMIQAACEAVVNFQGYEMELPGGRTDWTEYPWPIAFDARPENDDERNLRCFLLDMQRKQR